MLSNSFLYIDTYTLIKDMRPAPSSKEVQLINKENAQESNEGKFQSVCEYIALHIKEIINMDRWITRGELSFH
jgi:hypothetical protein